VEKRLKWDITPTLLLNLPRVWAGKQVMGLSETPVSGGVSTRGKVLRDRRNQCRNKILGEEILKPLGERRDGNILGESGKGCRVFGGWIVRMARLLGILQ